MFVFTVYWNVLLVRYPIQIIQCPNRSWCNRDRGRVSMGMGTPTLCCHPAPKGAVWAWAWWSMCSAPLLVTRWTVVTGMVAMYVFVHFFVFFLHHFPFIKPPLLAYLLTLWWSQGTADADPDGREKSEVPDKTSPFEEDKNPEMKSGEEGDPSKANGRGLLNGMDRDCKDFK